MDIEQLCHRLGDEINLRRIRAEMRGEKAKRIYMGRFEADILDAYLWRVGVNGTSLEGEPRRREFYGLPVFIVDAARHLEVGCEV